MGREIRRVPPNWEHPKDKNGKYKPLHDKSFAEAGRIWLNNCIAWNNGTHEDLIEHPERKVDYPFYWQWDGNPPNQEYYRPEFTNEPTWYQVYETVSEGTPVTPPFATKEEIVEYLVANGDFWDQDSWNKRFTEPIYFDAQQPGWNRDSAQRFVDAEWCPSALVNSTGYHTPKTM